MIKAIKPVYQNVFSPLLSEYIYTPNTSVLKLDSRLGIPFSSDKIINNLFLGMKKYLFSVPLISSFFAVFTAPIE